MSLLPNGVYANSSLPMFQLINASSINVNSVSANQINVSTLYGQYISAPDVEVSSIYATVVDIDFQRLTATPTELLLNGVPIATLQNISSIADWSYEPALSTINVNGNNIINTNQIQASNAVFQNLIAYNALFVSAQTSTISAAIITADFGGISTLSCSTEYVDTSFINLAVISTLSATTVELSTINGFPISYFEPGSVSTVSTFTDLYTSSLTVSSINGGPIISGSNWANYPALVNVNMNGKVLDSVPEIHNNGNILVYSGNDNIILSTPNGVVNVNGESINMTADEGANITTNATINLTAKNGFQGEINITADTGYADIGGVVNILANGGTTPLGVAYGGEVNITATTGGSFTTLSLTSAVNLNAAGINSYAGATSPIGSLTGFNFMHGDAGANITAGLPPIFSDPLCVYIRGNNGVLVDSTSYMRNIRPYSDSVQNPVDLYIEDYSNLITHGWVQLRGISTATFSNSSAIQNLILLNFSNASGTITNLSSINGQPLSFYEPGGVSTISSFTDLFTSSFTVSSINGLPVNEFLNPADLIVSTIGVPGSYSTTTGQINIGFTDTGYGGKINFNTLQNASTFQSLSEEHPPAGGASLVLSVVDETVSYSDMALRGMYFGVGNPGTGDKGHILAGASGLELTNVSSINNLPYPPSTGSQVSTALVVASTISTAYIQGANSNLFGLGLQGLQIDAANLFLSTPNVVHPGFFNGSTIAVNLEQARLASISSATISTLSANTASFNIISNFNIASGAIANINGLSTFELTCGRQAIFQSTIFASTVNTGNTIASSITLAQQGAFGLSTLMYVSTTSVPGSGTGNTSTCMYINTDFSVGQGDIFAQQLILGAGNVGTQSTSSEVIMYQPDGGRKTLNVNNNDRTIRIQTSGTSFTPGYILDTFTNAPFFSTINQSTAMMAYFPSTALNTIGISTISVMPPIQYFGSWYSSTSQTVIGANTITPLTFNSESLNIGGFTYSGSTINVPVGGVYEITHSVQFETTSGGTNEVQFFPLKNGAVVPQTNSIVSITNNGDTLGTISFFDMAVANDKYGIAIYSADTNMRANAIAAGATPAVPSIITNIKRL